MRAIVVLHVAVFIGGFIFGAACMNAQASPGQVAFERRCGDCHGTDSAKEGPALRGVVGRPAGKQPAFPYSDALKAASFTWDKQTLDRWLTDPEAVVPGNDMAFRLTDSAERDRIIDYLAGLK